jgi:hypothetical protein
MCMFRCSAPFRGREIFPSPVLASGHRQVKTVRRFSQMPGPGWAGQSSVGKGRRVFKTAGAGDAELSGTKRWIRKCVRKTKKHFSTPYPKPAKTTPFPERHPRNLGKLCNAPSGVHLPYSGRHPDPGLSNDVVSQPIPLVPNACIPVSESRCCARPGSILHGSWRSGERAWGSPPVRASMSTTTTQYQWMRVEERVSIADGRPILCWEGRDSWIDCAHS